MLRRARAILGDEQEAREVLQELFASLLARPSQFSGRSSILTWLYSATTHACLNRLRNNRTRMRLLESNSPAPPSNPDAEELSAARQLLQRLPEEVANAAIYYYFDQMTQAEIADVMECSRRHVVNLLGRFRERAEKERRRDETHAARNVSV